MTKSTEVIPFIHLINASERVKKELYLKFFYVKHLGNIKGSMPIKGIDFNEDDNAYRKRLKEWKYADMDVLFEGWKVKDLKHWHQCENSNNELSIIFDFNTYTVTMKNGREHKFPAHPETLDDFINDCHRIGVKLFWKQEIFDKFELYNLDNYPDKDLNNILSQSLN